MRVQHWARPAIQPERRDNACRERGGWESKGRQRARAEKQRDMSRCEKDNREAIWAGGGSVSAPRTGLWLRRRRQSWRSLCTWPWGRRCAPGWRPWRTPRKCCCARRALRGTTRSRTPSLQTAPPWRQSPWRTTCVRGGGGKGRGEAGGGGWGISWMGLVELSSNASCPIQPAQVTALRRIWSS